MKSDKNLFHKLSGMLYLPQSPYDWVPAQGRPNEYATIQMNCRNTGQIPQVLGLVVHIQRGAARKSEYD